MPEVEDVSSLLPLVQRTKLRTQQLVELVRGDVRRPAEPGVLDTEGEMHDAQLGEMLAGVDLDLEPQPQWRYVLGGETVHQVDPALLELPLWPAEPRVQDGANPIEGLTDGLRVHLHQIDVLGVSGRRCEVQLVQRGSAAESETVRQLGCAEQLDDGAADDEVLLDLGVERPRRLLPPRGDVIPGDHVSGSTSTLMMSFQLGSRVAPAVLAARRSGV